MKTIYKLATLTLMMLAASLYGFSQNPGLKIWNAASSVPSPATEAGAVIRPWP